MPSVANMFADFLKLPDEHKELLFTFYDILYNSQPIVDHKLFKAFMDLSNENKMILTDFTQKFGELFKAEHFVKNYILESPKNVLNFNKNFWLIIRNYNLPKTHALNLLTFLKIMWTKIISTTCKKQI